MIKAIFVVLILYILGEVIAASIGLTIPGATIGLLVLTGYFVLRGGVDASSAQVFDAVSAHFALFFIPAATGVVAQLELVSQNWIYIALAIFLGTGVTIALTGLLMQTLLQVGKSAKTA